MSLEIQAVELPSGERLIFELREKRSRAPRRKYKALNSRRARGSARFANGDLMYAYRLTWERDPIMGRAVQLTELESGSATFRKPIEAIEYCKRYGIDRALLVGSDSVGTGDYTLTINKAGESI